MPKLKQTSREIAEQEVTCRLKDAMNRNQFDNGRMCKVMNVSPKTLSNRKRDPETLTLREIWAIERATGCKQTIPFVRKEMCDA